MQGVEEPHEGGARRKKAFVAVAARRVLRFTQDECEAPRALLRLFHDLFPRRLVGVLGEFREEDFA